MNKDGWANIMLVFDSQGIDPTWLKGSRCRYMMDAWHVLKTGNEVKVDDKVTPAQLRAAKRTSADSKWLENSGRHGILHLAKLVRRCLGHVLATGSDPTGETLMDDENGMEVAQEVEGGEGEPDEKINFSFQEFADGKVEYHLDSGIIKQCPEPALQAVHIDDSSILGWNITRNIWLGGPVTAEEWLHCGYVIDLPLSKEGLWLRVAVPDPQNKVFVMDWVFVPFGSFLVRSMALWHSGHAGSPGNTRFHATFTVGDRRMKQL